MKSNQNKWWYWLSLVLVASLLAACGSAPTQAVTVEETAKSAPADTAMPETPQVGGKMVLTLYTDPPTLDQQVAGGTLGADVTQRLGATLVTHDLEGKIVGYLAESWEISPDGLEYTFKLKDGVKFHNGELLTADDFVYSFERIQSPDFQGFVKQILRSVAKVEAIDPLTVKYTLNAPDSYLLNSLTVTFTQPVNRKAVEAAGENYGRSPVGVGPYVFKEWATSEKIVLERNPDFNWGPAYAHQGPAYIQELEFRILPEPATIIAGLEAGEIDFSEVYATDISRFQNSEQYNIFQAPMLGIYPYVAFNYAVEPLGDVRVRQALSYATDKESLIKVVTQGNAIVQWGPLSASMPGYWSGVEQIGYIYDLEKAKSLMQEAGYVYNSDGMLEKDGQVLTLEMKVDSTDPNGSKTAEVLKEQYKALGVEIEILQVEQGTFYGDILPGGPSNFQLAVPGMGGNDDLLLWMMFHKDGPINIGMYDNPDLNALLDKLIVTVDTTEHGKLSADAQKYIVENALVIPTFTQLQYLVSNPEVQGIIYTKGGDPRYAAELFDAYIVEK